MKASPARRPRGDATVWHPLLDASCARAGYRWRGTDGIRRRRRGAGWKAGDPGEQCFQIVRSAARRHKLQRIVSRHLVDHDQARFHCRSMTGVDAAPNRRAEQHRTLLLQPHESVPPCGIVGRKACTSDRDQPPTGSKPRERGGQMPPGGISHATFNVHSR